jgi:hypothetical protein
VGSVVSKRGVDDAANDDADSVEIARPSGPLGPWRLSLSIVVAAVFTGMPLADAATSGVGVDSALIRSFVVAFFTWVALSCINRVLADATAAADRDAGRVYDDDPTTHLPLG